MLSLRERLAAEAGLASARRLADRQDMDLLRPGFEFDARENRFLEFACDSVERRSRALPEGYAAAFGAVWVDLPPGTVGDIPVYAARARTDGQIRKIRVTWDGTVNPEEELLGHVRAHALPIGHVRNRLAATLTNRAAAARGKVRVPLGGGSRWQVALKVRRGTVQQLILVKS